MFQNINSEENIEFTEKETSQKGKKGKQILKNIVNKQNLVIYILSFMISTVGFGGIAPFGIAFLGAACSSHIPIGVVCILTYLGTFIGLGKEAFLGYLLTSLLFFILTLVIRPKWEETEDRKKLGIHVGIATILGQGCMILFQPFLVYNVLETVFFAITAVVFYKIFVGSLNMIKDFGVKKAFSVEEVIGASLILAIGVAGFKDFAIFGYSIKNILSILIVLIMGWQNGMLIGATTGTTIGVVLGIIGNADPLQVAAYALSGLIAGLLNRLGKVGVVIGFIIGNAILTYVSNGNTETIIIFQEILIASLGLLAVPKSVKIDIDDLFGKRKCLPVTISNQLEQKEDTIYKLNTVSDAISEVAKTYQEVAATVVEEEDELVNNRNIFIEELRNNLEDKEDNLLYDDLMEDEEILKDIFGQLLEKEILVEKDIVTIFANHNNYIIGWEEEANSDLREDISIAAKSINAAYRLSKINFVWKRKIEENKKTMGNQLEGISKAISSIAEDLDKKEEESIKQKEKEIAALLNQKNITIGELNLKQAKNGRYGVSIYTDICEEKCITECKAEVIQKVLEKNLKHTFILQDMECPIKTEKKRCNLNYLSEDNYQVQLAVAKQTKEKSPVSGDTSLYTKLADGKYLMAISDGMGSGIEARKSSKIAIKMLQRLLSSGFDKEVSMQLINSTISSEERETFATLDIAILDLYQGNIEFIKNGACPTYIKNRRKVDIIKNMSLPAGIIENIDITVYDRDVEENDILVMCSDGILESNQEYKNKELWMKYLLEDIETTDVQKMADIILQEAIDNGYGIAKDDMTIMVAKIIKK